MERGRRGEEGGANKARKRAARRGQVEKKRKRKGERGSLGKRSRRAQRKGRERGGGNGRTLRGGGGGGREEEDEDEVESGTQQAAKTRGKGRPDRREYGKPRIQERKPRGGGERGGGEEASETGGALGRKNAPEACRGTAPKSGERAASRMWRERQEKSPARDVGDSAATGKRVRDEGGPSGCGRGRGAPGLHSVRGRGREEAPQRGERRGAGEKARGKERSGEITARRGRGKGPDGKRKRKGRAGSDGREGHYVQAEGERGRRRREGAQPKVGATEKGRDQQRKRRRRGAARKGKNGEGVWPRGGGAGLGFGAGGKEKRQR